MHRIVSRMILVPALASAWIVAGSLMAADTPWPQWRGPDGEGHAKG